MPRQVIDRSVLQGEAIELFRAAIRSPWTKDPYERRLINFLNFIKMSPDEFITLAKKEPAALEKKIISFISLQKQRVENGEITGATVSNFLKAIRLLLEMNDVSLNWKKIRRILPSARRYALDRIPTIDEIREIVDAADLRGKALTLVFVTSGVREGAIEYFQIRDYSVVEKEGETAAGRLLVYRGEPEMHVVFVTPEAVNWLNRYIQFRRDHGEKITQTSPLFRDKFDPIRGQYGHGKTDSQERAVPMTPHAVRQFYNRLLFTIGLRKEKKRRHDFSVHSLRKWFKTRCEMGGMRPIDVETLLNHSTGISDSYYRPTETELLNEYLHVVDNLGISTENKLRMENQILKIRTDKIDGVLAELAQMRQQLGLE